MLDHVALNVTDYERSRSFYLQALAPLGIEIVMEFPDVKGLGLGERGMPYLWICERGIPSTSTHVALSAPDPETVDAFYEAAIAAGGVDNGPPGLRPAYHEGSACPSPALSRTGLTCCSPTSRPRTSTRNRGAR